MSRTRLGVTDVRARIVLDAIRADPQLVATVADIAHLPRLAGWREDVLGQALDVLIARAVLTEAADGRLVVHPHRWAA